MERLCKILLLAVYILCLNFTACRLDNNGLQGSAGTGARTPAAFQTLFLESKADGSGISVNNVSIYLGDTLPIYAIQRNEKNEFVSNLEVSWVLSGGVGQLNILSSGKSANYLAQDLGSSRVKILAGGVTQEIDIQIIPAIEPKVIKFSSTGSVITIPTSIDVDFNRDMDSASVLNTGNWDWSCNDGTISIQSISLVSRIATVTLNIVAQPGQGNSCVLTAKSDIVDSEGKNLELKATNLSISTVASLAITGTAFSSQFSGSSETQSYLLTNSGDLTATGISIPALSAPLSIVGNTCPVSLASGESCTIQVKFTSPGEGSFSQNLNVNFNDGVSPQAYAFALNATGVPVALLSPSFVYTGGQNWNTYIKADGGNMYSATNTVCDGTESRWNDCLHTSEILSLTLPGGHIGDCSTLTVTDSLNAFQWICDDSVSPIRFRTVSLKPESGLSVMLNTNSWKTMIVAAEYSSYVYYKSPATALWQNDVKALPANLTNGAVVLPDGADATDTIYTFSGSVLANGYSLTTDKLSVVGLPGAELKYAGGTANCNTTTGEVGTDDESLIMAGTQKFLWLEGGYNIVPVWGRGLTLLNVSHSRLHNLGILNSVSPGGNQFTGKAFRLINVRGIGDKNADHNSKAFLFYANDSLIYHSRFTDGQGSSGGTSRAIELSGSNNDLVDISTTNTVYDTFRITGSDNIFVNVLVGSSNNSALYLSGSRNTVHNATSGLSGGRGVLVLGNNSTLSSVVSMGNGTGFYVTSDNNKFFKIISTQNATGFDVSTSSNNQISGHVGVGSNTTNCTVAAATNTGFVNSTCTTTGTSGSIDWDHPSSLGSLYTGLDLTNTFVGRVTTDDSVNTVDATGQMNLNSLILEPIGSMFENFLRYWGRNGTSFFSADSKSSCNGWTYRTCRIYDYSLSSSDTVLLNRSFTGNASNAAFVAGASCPASVHGNISVTNQNTIPSTYLLHATEIMLDGVGNDNGLCESNEHCIYSPNVGIYQGHGPLTNSCIFTDGTITGVTMKSHSINGR